LLEEWNCLAFWPGEDVDEFALRLSSLITMCDNDDIKEKVVDKFLRVVPKKYAQVALVMEMLLGLSELTSKEVAGRLKAVDGHDQPPPNERVTIGGKFLFTEEHWLARRKKRKKGSLQVCQAIASCQGC
jgi:hypothetical protein